MLPVLFRIGSLEIPSFGVMLACGILLAYVYFIKQFPAKDKERVASLVAYSIFAGMAGARLNYIFEHWHSIESFRNFLSLLISRSGLTFYGGILGGIITAILYCKKHGLPIKKILDAGSPAICIGYAVGRIGCQLAGDGDYGTPSSLPWAMAYPDGTVPIYEPVHPTPVYETILYGIIFVALIRWKRRGFPEGRIFATFLIFAGLERFLIEFIRLNPVVFLRLTEAQIISIVLICIGVQQLLFSFHQRDSKMIEVPAVINKT
ncbi:prolipoprotein diacylglyceryl transferase [bacterium]|nr:prolipoprotein diacylglyceryl transferase [bacterium]